MNKTIRHTVTIRAAPRQVFGALLSEKKHAKFTGEPATISRRVGDVCPGRSTGKT